MCRFPKDQHHRLSNMETEEKGKAGRCFSLTEKGRRYLQAGQNFIASLEDIERSEERKNVRRRRK